MSETQRYIPPEARKAVPPPLPPEVRKGPPPLPRSDIRVGPPPLPREVADVVYIPDDSELLEITPEDALEIENSREIHTVENLTARSAEQLRKTYFAFSKNREQGTEISIALAKGEKRDEEDRGEDSILVDKETGLHGIADGLGGVGVRGSGALASERAMDSLPKMYKTAKAEILSKPLTREIITAFVEDQLDGEGVTPETPTFLVRKNSLLSELANLPDEILVEMVTLQKAIEMTHQEIKKLNTKDKGNTTLSVGKTITLENGHRFEVFAQVGDGKIRQVREDGSSDDCIKEHSLANILRARGFNIDAPGFTIQLGGETHDKKSIDRQMTHALGGKVPHARPFIGARFMQEGESMVYASDGVADVDEAVEEIAGIVSTTKENPTVAQKILDATKAAEAGQEKPKHDDKAVLSVTFGELKKSGTQAA